MNKKATYRLLSACLFVGLAGSSLAEELGLSQQLSSEGVVAVGQTVKSAVENLFSSTEDAESIQSQITAIMDEAAATGNAEAVRYAIVGAMDAAGPDNLELVIAAINSSKAFTDFKDITAFTVNASKEMILANAGGGQGDQGGDKELGGDKEQGGQGDQQTNMEQGGGDGDNPLDEGDDADIDDEDVPGTPV